MLCGGGKPRESYIYSDPRAACFHARFALEALVHWLYRHDTSLRMPYDEKLGALLHETSFQDLLTEAIHPKVRVIHKMGNQAVHSPRVVHQYDALQVVKELYHLCYWWVSRYFPQIPLDMVVWDVQRIPKRQDAAEAVPRRELEALEEQLSEQNEAALRAQRERDALDSELQALREQLTSLRAEAANRPDTHDYSEAETRSYLIDVELRRAGWSLEQTRDKEYEVRGMPNKTGLGYADYVLWGEDGASRLGWWMRRRQASDAERGRQQAKLYGDCLEQMHGQRPILFYTNGYEIWMWDDVVYPPRKVLGFYRKEDLERLIYRRTDRKPLDLVKIKDEIVERYYQKRVIGSIFEQVTQGRRKALLVMATGTGKTRTAIALVDVLQRLGWVKRALFLADRRSLVNQTVNAFKSHLPDASPVNLLTEKNTDGRVYICTYPTMMGLIDESKAEGARFGVGYFDLVIIDEAHRSVYQKYGAIFRYFDALLVGLTATPREQVDKNTYELFDLESGVPTDAYDMDQAVRDGFLVPPRVQQVDLRFPREGIDYKSLSEEEKERWENIDWGENVEESALPDRVEAHALNLWLFNQDTVDKALQYLMEWGHKVEGGDRLAKTILFARNREHARFVEERFNHHYPQHKGHFARTVLHDEPYVQSLIDDFSQKEKAPHLAISVDMLDTGIDVPEVANLVFFETCVFADQVLADDRSGDALVS